MLDDITEASQANEIADLQRQVAKLEQERDILQQRLEFDPESPIVRSRAIVLLARGRRYKELSNLAASLGATEGQVVGLLNSLRLSGYNVVQRGTKVAIVGEFMPSAEEHIKIPTKGRRLYTFGIISDTHLCSKSQRLDVVETAYDEFKRRKIHDVYLIGNHIDGEASFNRYEIFVHGVTDQIAYFCDHYPQRSGITTRFITGDCHEGWFAKQIGLDVGKYTEMFAQEMGRKDLKYIGFMECDLKLRAGNGSSTIRLFHPGGGSSYALSYRPQKIVEAYSGGEKPNALVLGHFHKSGFFRPRGVATLLAGCCQDQTRFMRKKSIAAHVAFWIVTVELGPDGSLMRFVPEEYPYYDKQFYQEQDWLTTLEV